MSSKTINNHSYASSGYTMHGGVRSVTIGTMGVIGGPGLAGGTKAAYGVLNHGTITGTIASTITGKTAGVQLQDGGTVSNSGAHALIQGYTYGVYVGKAHGVIANNGTISATHTSQSAGVLLAAGGTVTNTGPNAVIEGYEGVFITGATGSLSNSGKIEGHHNNSAGVILSDGGSVTNADGALIEAEKAGVELKSGTATNSGKIEATGATGSVGVYFAYGGTFDNIGKASVIEGATALYMAKAKSTVTNAGTIDGTGGTGSIGVVLDAGGLVTNHDGALIEGVNYGLVDVTGTVLNAGRITASGAKGRGVYVTGGSGAITNEATGLIKAFYGVVAGQGTSVTNLGTIVGVADGVQTNALINEASGKISGKLGVDFGSGTLTNFGTIASTQGASGTAIKFLSAGDVFINEGGSKLTGKVTADSGIMDLAGTKGVIAGIGKNFTGFTTVQELAAANWTFTGTNTILTGQVLAIDGTATVSGEISGAGSLSSDGGTTTFVKGAALTVAVWQLNKTTVVYDVNLSYGGKFSESAGTLKLVKDSATFTGTVSFTGGTVTGTGGTLITRATTTLAGFTVSGGATWEDFGTINQSLGLTLGNAGGGMGILKVEAKAVLDIQADVGVAVAAGGKGTIQNAGTLEKTAGTGISAIASAIANTGTIILTSGTIDLMGAVTGTGAESIGKAATLQVDSAVAAAQTVKFVSATGGELILNDAAGTGLSFAGQIGGFKGADRLDLRPFAFSGTPTVGFSQAGTKGTLTVTDGAQVARITLFGQYVAAGFKLASDGAGGTVLTYTAPGAEAQGLAPPHHT